MAAADATLPFASGSLSGVLCSDAFHYFPQKSVAARELERVLDDEGAMVLTRVANAGLEPHEGYELEPAEYEGLFMGLVTSMQGEGELIEAYLARQLPRLADRRPPEALATEKWLTLFGSRSERFFRDYGTFEEFPHAVGRLGLNPIYVDEPAPDGGRTLHFRFPGAWYAFEDARYRDYAAPRARVPPEVIEAVDRGRRSPELDALIASFALVGLPERYADPPASPWTRAPSAAPAANT
jgi:SAM-dependent methyltransferase